VAWAGACSAATFFAREGLAGRGAAAAAGVGLETGGAVKESSPVTAVVAVDFCATFLAAVFFAAVFFAAVFLTAAFFAVVFAAVLVAALLVTRLVAGGVSWSVSLVIRNRLENWGAG
jgi:hypothetical protein